jgi:hypothetical protein
VKDIAAEEDQDAWRASVRRAALLPVDGAAGALAISFSPSSLV